MNAHGVCCSKGGARCEPSANGLLVLHSMMLLNFAGRLAVPAALVVQVAF